MAVNIINQAQPVLVPGTNFRISRAQQLINLTTAEPALAAGDYLAWAQFIEGSTARELFNDVSSISLLVYSSLAPLKFSVAIRSPDSTSSLVNLCTVNTANTPTLITLPNIPAFSGGNFSASPGVLGYVFSVCLAAGSTFIAPAAGTWQSGNFLGVPGMSNWCASGSPSFSLWFIQHEPGALCTTLIDRPFTDNLQACKRYYQKLNPYGNKFPTSGDWRTIGQFQSGTTVRCNVVFPVEMAKVPTISIADNGATLNSLFLDAVGSVAVTPPGAGAVNATGFNSCPLNAAQGAGANLQPVLGQWQADTGW
jgi:hypothetical protein